MTKDIRHSFRFEANATRVVRALTDPERIRQWWTAEVKTEGDLLVMGWSGYGYEVAIRPSVSDDACRVVWRCVRSNMQDTDAWVGSDITFDLTPDGGETGVEFAHTGYKESPCYEVCIEGWAFFVGVSLKKFIETGQGLPYPVVQDPSKFSNA